MTKPLTESQWRKLLDAIRGTDVRVAMVVTGGGAGAVSRCLRRPGASETFIEAAIPYSRASLCDYLGTPPEGPFASAIVAERMAEAAWGRARDLQDGPATSTAVGLALTAALPTVPPRVQEHQIHVATTTGQRASQWSFNIDGDRTTRDAGESIAELMVYVALLDLIDSARSDAVSQESGFAARRG